MRYPEDVEVLKEVINNDWGIIFEEEVCFADTLRVDFLISTPDTHSRLVDDISKVLSELKPLFEDKFRERMRELLNE